MAIARVATTSVAQASRTNTTVSAPAGTAAGHVVVVGLLVGRTASTTVTAPSGWTLVGPITHSASDPYFVNLHLYYQVWDGASSWTWNHVTADSQAVAITYSGVDNGTILDVAAVTNTTGTGTVTQGTDATVASMTVAAGARLVGIRGAWDGLAITPPTNWTELYDLPVMWAGDRDFTAGGATGTIAIDDGNNNPTTNNRWSVIVAALRPGGSGTTYTRTPADPVGISDNVSAVLAGTSVQTPADPIGLSDIVTVTRLVVRTVTDGVNVTDTGAPYQLVLTETIPDPVGASDAVTLIRSQVITVADPVGLADTPSAQKAGDTASNPGDGAGITDATSAVLDRTRTPADAAGIIDVTSLEQGRPASDAMALSDTAVTALDRPRAAADIAGIADQVTAELVGAGTTVVPDTLGLTDSVSTTQSRPSATNEPVGVYDTVTAALTRVVTVEDFLGLVDAATGVAGEPVEPGKPILKVGPPRPPRYRVGGPA